MVCDLGCPSRELGSHINKRQNRLGEMESGHRIISEPDLAALLQLYGVTDKSRIATLTDLRRDNTHRGRWSGHRAVYPEQFRMFVDLEEDTDLIRTVQAEMVPGLLQCEPYVRALSESSLRRMQGDAKVMARTDRLSDQAVTPPEHPAPDTALQDRHVPRRCSELPVHDPEGSDAGVAGPLELVYIDQLVDFRYLEDKTDLVAHDRLWHRLSAAALSPEDTRAFMRELARDY